MLKAEAIDLKAVPIYFKFGKADEIKKIYEELKHREALPTVEEVDSQEHQKIDAIVFNHLKISKEKRLQLVDLLKKHILGRIAKART